MPNYRLTHRITGTTVPAMAGYWGADEQSATQYKLAGGGAYAWASATIPNAVFMGATVDTAAYNSVTVSGATDAAFDGAYTYNTTAAAWKKSTTHTLSKIAGTWTLTDTVTTYTAANNSLNIPPTAFTKSGGTATVSPATTSAKFASTAISGTWAAVNSGTGTPLYAERTIGEAWDSAESAVFAAMVAWIGGTEDIDSFRGYLPINADGTLKKTNVWMITSGGQSGDYDADRTYGDYPLWCNELIRADLTGVFENRTTAMQWAGAVKAWLKSTTNYKETGIVTFCRLRELPDAPEEVILNNVRLWRVRIPLEILYLTEDSY